jgi:ABC-type Na+ transport system ATPase subunit NatA
VTDYLIQAQGLHKSFGENHAVKDVSLHIAAGEIYGLVGSDGAGKTTTLRLLVGALQADAGEIEVGGYDVRKQVEGARSQIGYLSQRFSLYEDLTVLENIRFFAEVRGLSANEWLPRSMEILEFVGLAEFKDRRAGQLSGGMKQKLGLASALVTRPRVLLLDEPTTGVDPVTRQDFWQLVIKLVSTPLSDSPPIFEENGGSRRGVAGSPSSSPPPTWTKPRAATGSVSCAGAGSSPKGRRPSCAHRSTAASSNCAASLLRCCARSRTRMKMSKTCRLSATVARPCGGGQGRRLCSAGSSPGYEARGAK